MGVYIKRNIKIFKSILSASGEVFQVTIFIPIVVSTVVVLDDSFVPVIGVIFGVAVVVLDVVNGVVVFVVSAAVGTVDVVDAKILY